MAGGFDSLGLMPELLKSVDELGWSLPTDIQDEAIPLIMGGGDVMAAAETGSGKTAAFSLPIIQCVHERIRSMQEALAMKATTQQSAATVTPIRINHNDKEALLEVHEGLRCKSNSEKAWLGARATHGVRGGKYYFEATMSGSGLGRLGWSTMAAHYEIGRDSQGFGYGGTGMKSFDGNFEKYGGTYGDGDVVGVCIDWGAMKVSYSVNGQDHGEAFRIPDTFKGTVLFPAILLKKAELSINFGEAPFRFPRGNGFIGIANANKAHLVSSTDKVAFAMSGPRKPLAVVLEPARDLAEQVYDNINAMARYVAAPQLNTLLLVGGDNAKDHKRKLEKGVDIVVGTLGKVGDMVKSKHLDLSQVRFFVLDEADRLTEPENMSQIMQLYNACPVGGTGDNRLQVCFFSATLHSEAIVNLSNKLCFQPVWVDLKGVDSVPETVHHVVYKVTPEKDFGLLSSAKVRAVTDFVHPQGQSNSKSKPTGNQEESSLLIKELKPQILVKIVDHFKMSQCIVFCRTNLDCDNLETFLNAYGGGEKFSGVADSGKLNPYSCCVLGGMRSTQERRRNLEAFREGAVRFLICTDVAARGIDIQGLPFVINMTLPDESEHYIHRIGRVGRADLMGLAISIVADEGVQEKVWYHSCANRGKGCTNRQLKSQGGCTIWYNEGALLSDVCQRLHVGSIPSLQEDFSLPPELAEKQVEYGEDSIEKMDVVKVDELHHYQTLGPTVKELAAMEFEAQNIFLKFAHGQTD